MSDTPKCIDISHWQGFADFTKVHAAGVIACIMKATEGTVYVDATTPHNFANATKAGIACCTYHWLKAGGTAAEQMAFYLKTVNPKPGERMVIDYEEDGCTLDDLHAAVNALLVDPRGLQVTVYGGALLKSQLGQFHDPLLADHTSLWLAQYNTEANISWPKATWPQWSLWQYSETGKIDGISASGVDMNKFNGSDANLLKWINPVVQPVRAPTLVASPAPTVLAKVADKRVDIAVTAPDGVSISLTVNGVPQFNSPS